MESTVKADLYVIGLDTNVAGDEGVAFSARLRRSGFQFFDQPQLQQVTVAKQRTMFQTQARARNRREGSSKKRARDALTANCRREREGVSYFEQSCF